VSGIPNLLPALPELVIAVGAMALLMAGVFRKEDGFRFISNAALVVLVIAFIAVVAQPLGRQETFGGMFVVDGFGRFGKALVLIGSGLTLFMSQSWLRKEAAERFEYPVVVLFATLGMLMMVSANNLISLYLGLELQSLALYVLAAYQRGNSRATEAGLKYFVLGSLASGMLLYGASLIYGFAGTTAFDALALGLTQGPRIGVVIGVVFVLAGLAFKISAVPFHMWTPDVYEGAPTPVTALFSVAPKVAAFWLLLRVMIDPFGSLAHEWHQVVTFISVASMVLGSFAAIVQTNIKRLMAYSSIGHVGYGLIGLAVGGTDGIRGVMVYLAIYVFMNVGTFAVILAMRRKGRPVEGIADLAGLSKTHPGMALALTVFMFSMAGIPPTAGFWGKFTIFLSAIDHGAVALAIIGVVTSVVGAYYYLRIIKVMYFDEPVEALDRGIGAGLGVIMTLSALAVVVFTVAPATLLTPAAAAAATLFGG
jgi:NADH-quinone oxidoreductase subunit N